MELHSLATRLAHWPNDALTVLRGVAWPDRATSRRSMGLPGVRAFVSSTFQDMQAERDILARKVFPAVRTQLRRRALTFYEVDLRWGVTREEAETEGAVSICLREIDGCVPFFIALIGDRYGWVPDDTARLPRTAQLLSAQAGEQCSATELEIRYAMQAGKGMEPYFFFRAPEMSARLGFPAEAPERIAKLKTWIEKRWSGRVQHYDDIDTFERIAADTLTAAIGARATQPGWTPPSNVNGAPMPQSLTRRLREIERQTAQGRPLVLHGEVGAGATWLCDAWLQAGGPDTSVIHIDARRLNGASLDAVIRERLSTACGWQDAPARTADANDSEPASQTMQLLASLKGNWRICVDHIDDAYASEHSVDIDWLPGRIPGAIHLLAVCKNLRAAETARNRGCKMISLTALCQEERQQFCASYLKAFGKTLTFDQAARLARAPYSTNLGAMVLALNEIRRFGSFEALEGKIAALASQPGRAELAGHCLQAMGTVLPQRARDALPRILAALAISEWGLEEAELCAAASETGEPVPAAYWCAIKAELFEALAERDGRFWLTAGPILDFIRNDDTIRNTITPGIAERLLQVLSAGELKRWAAEAPALFEARNRLDDFARELRDIARGNAIVRRGPIFAQRILSLLSGAHRASIFQAWLEDLRSIRAPAEYAADMGSLAAAFGEHISEDFWRFDTNVSEEEHEVRAFALLPYSARKETADKWLRLGPRLAEGSAFVRFGRAAAILAVSDGLNLPSSLESLLAIADQAVAAAQALKDHKAKAVAFEMRGRLRIALREHKIAMPDFAQAIASARKCGHGLRLASSLVNAGDCKLQLGLARDAIAFAKEAESLSFELGLRNLQYRALDVLIPALCERAQWSEAFDACRRYLDRAGESDARKVARRWLDNVESRTWQR
ncbi:MAG TPA: hypothetical protein DCL54_07370 [Alphaproteobacteria bacterium]|nr:hypothetical protein [Alphaproteobacteria bacterium]